MRENLQNRKILSSVKVVYKVTGLNQDRLISTLKKHDILLYDLKKLNNRQMLVSVNLNQSKNFFAITKEMCYNIEKVKNAGRGKIILFALKNAGLFIGALLFVLISSLSSDLIFAFNFTGSGSVYQRELKDYLNNKGISIMTRFSSFELDRLEDEILASSDKLTFVSAKKVGNTLEIYTAVKTDKIQTLGGNVTELRAVDGGKIEQIKVYRGTAVVGVGDLVEAGALLVDGYAVIKDQVVQTNVLAYVTMLSTKSFTYEFNEKGQEQKALLLAQAELDDRELLSYEITSTQNQSTYEYTVIAEYRSVYYAG